ncbi:hypothetical protein B0A93_23930 [Pseudomonas syringae]|nr:hypothetical protein B0A93_23930 [Pseudomonas syringae]
MARKHPVPVGASLLAKGSAQTPKMHRLKHRLREQARSHKISAAAEHLRGSKTPPTCGSVSHGLKTPRTCGSELARERVCTSAENASTETPPSRASSLPQGHQCRRAFAWLETQPTCVSNPHGLKTTRACGVFHMARKHPGPVGASLLAKGSAQTPKMHRLKHRLREQAHSHKVISAAGHSHGSKHRRPV